MSIIVKGSGGGAGGEDLTAVLTEQDALIQEIEESLVGKASGANITPETVLAGYRGYRGKTLVKGTYNPATADPELIPNNIRQGVDIFGVVGTMAEAPKIWSEKGTFSGFNNYQGHTITTANSGPKRIFGGGTKHYYISGAGAHSQSMLLNGTTVTIGDTEDGDETASITFGANSVKIPRTASFLSMSGTVSYWITNAEI